LREALGIKGKATAAARDASERCGTLCGSFREGADALLRLTGMRVSVSKLRKTTLAFGEACVAAQNAPGPDVRDYAHRPPTGATPVERTLFCMADGGSANCCKADTKDVKRKYNMRYGWFRRNGYYIGSGHVEAAVRVLVVRRCKQAGMHWRHANAVRMAAIHAQFRSHRKAT